MFGYETKVTRAGRRSRTVRTSIPDAIVHMLEISAGDELEWVLEFGNGATKAVVRKVTKPKNNVPSTTSQRDKTTTTTQRATFEEV